MLSVRHRLPDAICRLLYAVQERISKLRGRAFYLCALGRLPGAVCCLLDAVCQTADGRLVAWPSGRRRLVDGAWQTPSDGVLFYVAIGLSMGVMPGNEARLNSCVF